MRLIDADALIKSIPETSADIFENCRNCKMFDKDDVVAIIESAPTIEAEPVKHGRWIFSPDHAEGICTRCNYKIYGRPYQNTYMIVPYNHCPNCGAQMEADHEID